MTHPALVLALLWLITYGVARLSNRRVVLPGSVQGGLTGAAIGIVGTFIAIVLWYAVQPAYFDPAEPTIPAVAWVFRRGMPLYPALDAPERYAHIYGPILFIVHATALLVSGPGIIVSKIVGAIAILASLAVGFETFRKRAGTHAALAATAVCCVVYLGFSNVTFWTRSDPLLILCVTLGLYLSNHTRARWMLLVGVAIGIAINLKVTGPLYLLPGLAAAGLSGTRMVVRAAGVAAVTAALPFLLPNVSFTNYTEYLQLSASNGLEAGRLRQNVEWSIFLLAPVFGLYWRARAVGAAGQPDGRLVPALAAAMMITAIAAAKPGGGPFHLLPFMPVLALIAVGLPRAAWTPGTRALAFAFVATALLIAVPRQLVFVKTVAGRDLGEALAFIRDLADGHPGKRIAVGYAGTSHLSYARPEAVFRAGDYLLDAPAIQEHRLAGLSIPEATLRALDGCRIDFFLVPAGAAAFVVPSAYFPNGPREVFPDEFLRVFHQRYRRITVGGPFDVWECGGPP